MVGFALEQTLRDATLTVFSYVDFKVASAYKIYAAKFNLFRCIYVFVCGFLIPRHLRHNI
ncbi:MAG: hypothetical protein LBH59_11245 [Planctomycetaceae bacterium]|nr:hypothetical protein [Planctomycetaceae bacterium]